MGVDIQGFGGNAPNYKGFLFKSQGVFAVISKQYRFFNNFNGSVHWGTNISFEELSKVNWPNFTTAWEMRFNHELGMLFEYDFATNQKDTGEPNAKESYWKPHRGYFHAGLHWRFLPNLKAEVNFLDLFRQRMDSKNYSWGREIKLTYFTKF